MENETINYKDNRGQGIKNTNTQLTLQYDYAKIHIINIECNKKFKEYMFCKYENGITFDNIIDYTTDNLIKTYYYLKSDILNNSGTNDEIYDGFIKEINIIIENEIEEIRKKNRLTRHDWIVMANHRHNNRYDYKEVAYENRKTNVIIKCYYHGIFMQTPFSHLSENGGCYKCNVEIRTRNLPPECTFLSHPKSKYWSYKNRLNPNEVSKSSHDEYIFDCYKCGHEIMISPNQIQNGYWCSYCGHHRLCNDDCYFCFENSFASHFRSLQWSSKNKLTPREVFKSSNKKYLFDCNVCNKEYISTLANICNGHWCDCARYIPKKYKKRTKSNIPKKPIEFEKSFASHEKSKYFSKNNEKMAIEYSICSDEKVYFSCDCGHEFKARIANVTSNGSWCPYCGPYQRKLCDDINCVDCYAKSFASNLMSIHWSPQNEVTPRQMFKGSKQKCKFVCNVCNHTFETTLDQINRRGDWCNFCSSKELCELDKECKICFEKSFASSHRAVCWSDKNELLPHKVFKKSSNKHFFKCDDCHHTFNMVIDHITLHNQWCPYCNRSLLCDSELCNLCYENSFENNPKSKYLSPKNKENPRMISKSSGKKLIFDCPDCKEEYITSPNIITNGSWCGCTYNKTETKFYEYLKTTYNTLIIEKQKKFDWCKNINHLPFDFCIEEYKTIIEQDGNQHLFSQVKGWKSPEETQKIDKYKMIQAKNNGYSIIRITQQDIWYDKNNWKQHLHDALEKTKNSIGTPIHIFIGDMYTKHYFTL